MNIPELERFTEDNALVEMTKLRLMTELREKFGKLTMVSFNQEPSVRLEHEFFRGKLMVRVSDIKELLEII